MSDLDVIVPVLNEEKSIQKLLYRLEDSLSSEKVDYGVYVVDDNSTDRTAGKVKEYIKNGGKQGHINGLGKGVLYEFSKKTKGYSNGSRVKLLHKKGKRGKAYSILEASEVAKAPFIAMIDGDLQYPPEAVPQLYKLAKKDGVAVANRKKSETGVLRKLGSKLNIIIIERIFLGINCDSQSGLKVFKKEIIDKVEKNGVSEWTLDMPLLIKAKELGYRIGTLDIEFNRRKYGESKVSFLKTGLQIALSALKLKFNNNKVTEIDSALPSPLGSGLLHKGSRFITHSQLPVDKSALQTFYFWQKIAFLSIAGLLLIGLLINPITTTAALLGLLTLIYFIDFSFSFSLLLRSLRFPPEIVVSRKEIKELDESKLPIYTILCPLYKEANVLPNFIKAIKKLNWPKKKLDVLLLLEEDDEDTIRTAKSLGLPRYFRTLVVPHSLPKTKPKACNFGLAHAKGDFAVIYDAEDRPDPLQLKKAYIAFGRERGELVCLQSKLNYYNTKQNLLTRLFTAEYSLWFDLVLPGLQSIGTTIPLGGTSNHFRMSALRYLNAWDPFNVTEDCDLGTRLFKAGYKTAIINSTTYEEANSKVKSWLKQRSRWIKGYLQTYLVHTRNPLEFIKSHGIHALIFQLVIGMRMTFMIINPLLWLLTAVYFIFRSQVGYIIESFYPPPFYYLAVVTMVFGNFIYLYNYMIGLAKRKKWGEIKYVFLAPIYWLMASIAAFIAFYQLIAKPHYWEKTEHGLHLSKRKNLLAQIKDSLKVTIDIELPLPDLKSYFNNFKKGSPDKVSLRDLFSRASDTVKNNKKTKAGLFLIGASVTANFLNFLYNAYLGRTIAIEEFGIIALYGNIFALSGVVTAALGNTVSHKTAYLLGKHKVVPKEFWLFVRRRVLAISLIITLVWLFSVDYLTAFFHTNSNLPFLIFTPIWVVGFMTSVNDGFIKGSHKFASFAAIIFLAPIIKLISTIALVEFGLDGWVYLSIPLSLLFSLGLGLLLISRLKVDKDTKFDGNAFPFGFMTTSVLNKLSLTVFLTLDVILAKHFLSPEKAGEYALLSLAGKIVFFLGSLFVQFINPVISKIEGEAKDSTSTFTKLLFATFLASILGYLLVGVLGHLTIPVLFGNKTAGILGYLPVYALGIAAFTLANAIFTFHQAKREYLFAYVGFLIAVFGAFLFYLNHANLYAFVLTNSLLGFSWLFSSLLLHIAYPHLKSLGNNFYDFVSQFTLNTSARGSDRKGLNILVYNWRDTKHIWAGGAENYIQELAERWVGKGHRVTILCGNDRKNSRNEIINGVEIIRRGGFFTVYIWAFFYYIFKFRGKYDVIVDCENGVPFFTPLYSRVPTILLVHHVHQEIFQQYLIFPLFYLANFLESKLMPLVYRNSKIVTVSESSKKDLEKYRFMNAKEIDIVNPGVDLESFVTAPKTSHPSILYLGRLKPWKSLDVLIKAVNNLVDDIPNIQLNIAGFGESIDTLEKLVARLGIQNRVHFLGRVSDELRVKLLGESWVFVYPSTKEGWGITAIEANACGTPVVASDVHGLRDSIRNPRTGYLVEKGNPEAFSDKIALILKNKKLRKKLESHCVEWARNFSWDTSAVNFLTILEKEALKKEKVLAKVDVVYAERKV